MAVLNIEFERNELCTPENLARFLVLKQMGFIIEEQQANEATQT